MPQLANYKATKQVEQLYGRLTTIISGLMGVSIAAIMVLSASFSMQILLYWFSYMVVICAARLYSLKRFNAVKEEQFQPQHWLKLFMAGAFFSGCGAGFLFSYFIDVTELYSCVLLLMLYSAYIASNTISTSCYMPAFLLSAMPPTLLIIFRMLLEGEPVYKAIAITLAVFAFVMVGFAKNVNNTFSENINWRFDRDETVRELREQKVAAEHAMKAKTNFLASASHDLRQPLHALGLFHDALRYRISDSESLGIMDKISNSTQALNEMLHGMLDISKLDASVVESNPQAVNLYDCLNPIFIEFKERAKEKHVELVFDVPNGLSAFLDTALFERVVRNLIDNAIKYTDVGMVQVSARKIVKSDLIELSITDTGVGIPQEKLKEVFVEFSQLGNPERDRRKGLGLGLSIVKRLCELMSIDMDFISVYGEGTFVTLDLPAVDDADSLDSVGDSMYLGDGGLSEKIILVVEDNLPILDGTGLLLDKFDCIVLKALDANQAMTLAQARSPSLIIADYRLTGDVDGLELIGAIRSIGASQAAAILITGDTAPERLKSTAQSNVRVLHKPVSAELLMREIDSVLISKIK